MRRDERLDIEVFGQYLEMSRSDKGPWPLFHDMRHPPFYDGNGRRMIEWEELSSNDPSWRPWHLPHPPGTDRQATPAEGDEVEQAANPP